MKMRGFPDIKIKVFPDYNHFLDDKYYDISNSYLKLNIKCTLSGELNGVIIVNDGENVINKSRDLIFRITVVHNITKKISEYIFGTTHNDLTILQNGGAVRQYNLVPFHNRSKRRFSRKLTNSAIESLEMLLDSLYVDFDLLKPKLEYDDHDTEEGTENLSDLNKGLDERDVNIDAYVPSAVWVQGFDTYMKFISRKGLSSDNDSFTFCWYEEDKIRLLDFETIINQEPLKGMVVEEDLVGSLSVLFDDDVIPVFKYEFITESNISLKSNMLNASYLTTSTEKNGSFLEIIGTGETMVSIDRSGIYREMTYDNGYEEIVRSTTMNQYDSYAKFRTYGDTRLKPGMLIEITDEDKLIKNVNIIDHVVYEYSQVESYTHVFLMSNSEDIEHLEYNTDVNPDYKNYPEQRLEGDTTENYNNGEASKKASGAPEDMKEKFPFLYDDNDHGFDLNEGEWTEEDMNKRKNDDK